MQLEDHHLIVLMEECSETILELTAVIQRASKQLRFGRDEVQPGQDRANHERLRIEIMDVLACIRILQLSQQIERIEEADVDAHFVEKQEKISRMLAISRAQGRIEAESAESIESVLKARASPKGTPCTCEDTTSSACGIEQGGTLGELWYCRRQSEIEIRQRASVERQAATAIWGDRS